MFEKVKALVIGDVILDEYVYGKVERISPEAPVPVLSYESGEIRLGGAANVAANCSSLGANTFLLGIAGDDEESVNLEKLSKEKGVISFIVRFENRITTKKTRFVADRHQILRVDREQDNNLSQDEELKLEKQLEELIKEVDVVIVSDYKKGCITPALMRFLIDNHERVIVDPKPQSNMDLYKGVKLITPNKKEAAQMLNIQGRNLLDKDIFHLSEMFNSDVLVTLGEDGMKYYGPNSNIKHYPAVAKEVFDVTGAGDSVIATIGLSLALGNDEDEACRLANKVAAQVVSKFGTSVVDIEMM